jgi:hypothetical protein
MIIVHSTRAGSIRVFPNPASGAATYMLPPGTLLPAALTIRDVYGRALRRIEARSLNGRSDLSGMDGGTYLLEIEGGSRLDCVRFVVDR